MAVPDPQALATRLRVTFYGNDIASVEREASARLAHEPGDPVARAYLARAYYRAGRFAEARQVLAQVPAHADDRDTLLARADFALYVGELVEAKNLYRQVIRRWPTDLDGLFGLATVHLTLEQAHLAEELLTRAAPLVPPDDGYQTARKLVLEGGILGLKVQHGGLFEMLRHGPFVREKFVSAARVCPGSAYPRYALGRYYQQAPSPLGGGADRAIAEFREAARLDPFNYLPRAALIYALEDAHCVEEAADEVERFRRDFKDVPAALKSVS